MEKRKGGQSGGGNHRQHPDGLLPSEARELLGELTPDERRTVAERLHWPPHRIESAERDIGAFAVLLAAEPRAAVAYVLQHLDPQ